MVGVCLADWLSPSRKAEQSFPLNGLYYLTQVLGFLSIAAKSRATIRSRLRFKTNDINDLLKSLVLQDLGGGRISTVSYGSRDPITKTLQTFIIDLTDNPTLFELLGQVRGRELIVHAPHEIRGTMINAESRPQAVPGGEPIRADYINLLTEEGLQSISLHAVSRIQMADAELEKEFRAALETLASAHATDKKTVTLNFLGEGRRPVRVGYIREAPVWKTSYRLVLSDEDAPLLQGWAIVENTGDQDWKNVELSLVSGRPISFVMDLYSPLYAPRPTVAHELYASLQPQAYDQAIVGDLAESKLAESQRSESGNGKMFGRGVGRVPSARRMLGGAGSAGGGGGFGGGEYGAEDDPFGEVDGEVRDFDISQGVTSVAEAGDVGELFRYDIDTPVSIERQRSAMLPIVNHPVEASKVSIYNRDVHAKHPLNGIRLKNTSELHLMQGPITLFDGGAYAGDGKIAALPAGAERLVSYAMDLDVEVAPTSEAKSRKLVTVKLVDGMLHATHQHFRSWKYVIKNSGDGAKTVLVEHPLQPNWELVDPKQADETTRDRYRFAVEATTDESAELVVKERRIVKQVSAIGNFGEQQLQFYYDSSEVSDAVKDALQEIQHRQATIASMAQKKQSLQSELAVIESEQNRIRKNMQQLPRDSQLYKRYVNKFSEQEDEVERLRTETRELNAREMEERNLLKEYIMVLNVE